MGFIEEYRNGSKCIEDNVTGWQYKRKSGIGVPKVKGWRRNNARN